MPTDLAELLHQAAPEPTGPIDPERLWSAGRRRRLHRRATAAASVLLVAGLAVVGVGRPDSSDPARVVTTADSIIATEPAHGFSVEHPPTWRRATTSLTPNLTDPIEILSLGTGDLPPGGQACAQFPVAALEAMRPTDAFITVQERLSPQAAGLAPGQPFDETAGFPDRPDQFPPAGSKDTSVVVDCLAAPPVFDHWWFAFNDADRGFYVLVAIGTEATGQTRAEAWAILNSLHVDTAAAATSTTATAAAPTPPASGSAISGTLLDRRAWTVRHEPAHRLCVTLAGEDLGCDDAGPVIAPDADPATPRIALPAGAPSFDSGSLVYGFLPDRATDVELVHDDGRSVTTGLVIEPHERFWAIPVEAEDNPDTVIYRDAAGVEVQRFPI